MRARAIRFSRPVRLGVRAGDNVTGIDIMSEAMTRGAIGVPGEPGYRLGTIDVYYGKGPDGGLPGGETGSRYVIVRHPALDHQANPPAPFVIVIAMESVVDAEPMSAAEMDRVYGKDREHEFRPEDTAPPQKPRAVEAKLRGHLA